MLKYREEKYPRILSIHRIKEILNLVIIGAGSYHQIYVVLFLFIVCFLSTRENRVYMLLSILLLLGELCYLRYVVRFLERSVMIPVVVTMVLIVFFYQPEYEMLTSLIITFALVVFFAYVGCGMADTDGWEDNHVNKKSEVNSIYQVLSLNENNLYVWHIFTASGNIDGGYDRFDSYAFGQHHNSVFSGGWPVPSPLMGRISQRFGEKNNVFKLLAYNHNVYYVEYTDNQIDDIGMGMVEQYIRDHYNENAKARLVEQSGIYSIYSFCER